VKVSRRDSAGLEKEADVLGSKAVTKNSMQEPGSPQRPIKTSASHRSRQILPDNLKTGMENLSGYSMDDVKVHRNSDKPASQARAYAQGTDMHLGSDQEKHLPHEAWHVVQQKQEE
jgi:hypothetical protein